MQQKKVNETIYGQKQHKLQEYQETKEKQKTLQPIYSQLIGSSGLVQD